MVIKKIQPKEKIEFKDNELIILDFYAEWCGPCKLISRELKDISAQYPDLSIYKANVEENEELAIDYQVLSIPTLIFIKNNEVVDEIVGYKDKIFISDRIEEYL